jgi:hypothetical protein
METRPRPYYTDNLEDAVKTAIEMARRRCDEGSPTHGYDPTRQAAMAAFAKRWRWEQPRAAIGEAAGALSGRYGHRESGGGFPWTSQGDLLGRSVLQKLSQILDLFGAGEGNRTLDIQLGKLSFYH